MYSRPNHAPPQTHPSNPSIPLSLPPLKNPMPNNPNHPYPPPRFHYPTPSPKSSCISPADIKDISFTHSPPPLFNKSPKNTDYGKQLFEAAGISNRGGNGILFGGVTKRGLGGIGGGIGGGVGVGAGNGEKTMAERNREQQKRLQNRESAKRFRRMQKMRWENMKVELGRKEQVIGELRDRIRGLQSGNRGGSGSVVVGSGEQVAVRECMVDLYGQLLAYSANGGVFGEGGLYGALLGVHLRTLLCDSLDGGVVEVLKVGSRELGGVVGELCGESGNVLWSDVGDEVQVEKMKEAINERKPVAIAYERLTSKGRVTINAALAPVRNRNQVVVAEFVAPSLMRT